MDKIIKLLLLCLCFTSSVYAEEPSYYIGASYLNTETELLGETDNDSGYEARLGYILNKKFTFEASYLDFGTHVLPIIPDSGGSIEADGYSVSALGFYPIGDFNIIGKVGYLWWESEGALGTFAGPVAFTSDGSDLIIGVGLSYSFTDNIEIKVEYNDSQEFKWGSIGVNYRF